MRKFTLNCALPAYPPARLPSGVDSSVYCIATWDSASPNWQIHSQQKRRLSQPTPRLLASSSPQHVRTDRSTVSDIKYSHPLARLLPRARASACTSPQQTWLWWQTLHTWFIPQVNLVPLTYSISSNLVATLAVTSSQIPIPTFHNCLTAPATKRLCIAQANCVTVLQHLCAMLASWPISLSTYISKYSHICTRFGVRPDVVCSFSLPLKLWKVQALIGLVAWFCPTPACTS